MPRRLARAIVYLFGLTLFVLGGAELFCRAGCVENQAATLARRAHARDGQPRVLILGDSFTVEDPNPRARTLGNLLRRYFTEHGAVTINLARSGFGPQDSLDALDYFRAYGPSFHPDLVMLDYYVGNDLTDEKSRLGGGRARMTWYAGWSGELLEHSYLARLLREIATARRLRRETAEAERRQATMPAERRAATNPFLVTELAADPGFLAHNLLVDEPEDLAAWEGVKRVLRELKAYADGAHARFLINIIPQTLQVNDSRWRFYADLGFPMDQRFRSSTVPQDLMKRFCDEEKIVCNDLLPILRQNAQLDLYLENDEHWVAAGFTVGFQGIRAKLEAEHLLPGL